MGSSNALNVSHRAGRRDRCQPQRSLVDRFGFAMAFTGIRHQSVFLELLCWDSGNTKQAVKRNAMQ